MGNTSYTFKAYSDSSYATELTSASTDVTFLTQPAKPATPTVTTGACSGKLTISSSVSGGGGALSKWRYQQKGENDSSYGQWIGISSTSTTLTHTVTGLTDNTNYTFKVQAVNTAGSGVSGGGTESDLSAATALQDEELTATATTANLKLTIANHSGNWYYKYTTPSGGQCSGVVSGSTAVASSLQSSAAISSKPTVIVVVVRSWPRQQPPAPWLQQSH